jgi:putative ABC transport system permease protein
MRWLGRLLRKSRAEKELERELRFHLERQIADNLASGMPAEEARRSASIELGGVERVKEEVRDAHWESHLESLFVDFHYALRTLRNDSRTAFVAIFALALGIAASTVVFSVVYNSFFNALPYKHFRRMVVWQLHNSGNSGYEKERTYFSVAEIRAFQQQNHVFEEIIAHNGIRLVYDDGVSSRYWPMGALITANTFDYLGVEPLLGRGIMLDDGKPNAPPVFVMNYRFWQSEFGGDPKILGKSFNLNDTPTTLVGIMPPQFNLFNAVFWMPIPFEKIRSGVLMGRLKEGISIQAANADLNAIAHRLHRPATPGNFADQTFAEERFVVVAQTLLDSLIGNFRKVLYLLLAAVLLLMLVACSNVANLLLARSTAREPEIVLRAMLGATRVRLIRPMLKPLGLETDGSYSIRM